eukprot:1335376-Amorphochlora_amoeboformis.AAC.1
MSHIYQSATQSRCSRSVSRLRRATSLLKGVGVAAGVGLADAYTSGLPIGSALSSRSLAAHAEASGGEKDILVIGKIFLKCFEYVRDICLTRVF